MTGAITWVKLTDVPFPVCGAPYGPWALAPCPPGKLKYGMVKTHRKVVIMEYYSLPKHKFVIVSL